MTGNETDDPSAPAPEWLTDREVCAVLRITPNTLLTWRHAGKAPPYYRLGERRCITKRADLEAWLAARLVNGVSRKGPGRG